ncbi:CsbD family protein [Stieleria sp. JC731]|uniref:CsbD family protein n=1 Tax=Pirellulaceae TaxID=2691357 RepID=UPI001E5DED74|nr:CsbD family protein [Stieleria sp. JC731]MCC9601746.1 CsbD family protein [Stieleria sp. JC731]
MVNREQLHGQWNEVKGRLREHWGQLTENDLQMARGSAEQLVGVVQKKTGATRNEVENFLNGILDPSFTEKVSQAAAEYGEAAQHMAHETAEYMKHRYQDAASMSEDYAERFVDTVKSRPRESIAIAFGLGIAAGAFFFLGKRR